jgi:excisionase family DNA binding protein
MTNVAAPQELLTISETAELLRCSEESIRRKVRSGELPAVQLGPPGSAIRIPRAALEAWLYADPVEA